jgi:hypothetical protein
MAQSDNTFYSQLAQVLTPTQMANLFPRYYRDRLPDISGFQLATSQIAAGKFGEGLPSSPITSGVSSEYVSPRTTKSKRELESSLTGKVNEERLRKLLPEKAKKTFDEVVRNKKTQSFSSTDDPFSGLSDAELKSIGIKRSQQTIGPQSTRNIYIKDTMSVEAAKKKILGEFKSESKVSGFKFEDSPATFNDNRLTGNYYATHGAGMGNKEDNAKIQTELANYIAKKGKEAGYTDAAIKGMVANAIAESNLGLLPYGDHGGSGGVFHLHVRGAAAEAGIDPKKYHVNKSNVKDVDEYIASMKDSIDESFDLFQNNKNYASLNELMKTSNSFEETTTAFVRDFEKPEVVNAAARIAIAKKMGIDVVTLDETVPVDSMPKFVQVMKSMDGETLKKLGGIIETGPGGIGAGVDIVDFAEKLQTPEEFNKAEADLAKIMYEKGLTGNAATAEQVTSGSRVQENQEGFRRSKIKQELKNALDYAAAMSNIEVVDTFSGGQTEEQQAALAEYRRKTGGKLPSNRHDIENPDIPGAADVVLMTRDKNNKLKVLSIYDREDIPYIKSFTTNFSRVLPSAGVGAGYMRDKAHSMHFGGPNYKGGPPAAYAGPDWFRQAHAEGVAQRVDDLKNKRNPLNEWLLSQEREEDVVSEEEQNEKLQSVEKKEPVSIIDYSRPKEETQTAEDASNAYVDMTDEELKKKKEEIFAQQRIATSQENYEEEFNRLTDEANKIYEEQEKRKASRNISTDVETETGQVATATEAGLYEGGIINAKDNLKVVREDGSPTGIRVASDETAVIIPPDERRKARDFVSLDGTDQRTGLDSMDETTNTTKPGEAPLNQAKMSTAGYSPSNQSTIPSSLGAIDYSPTAIRAFARDKYADNHGFHSAPRTIYAQK